VTAALKFGQKVDIVVLGGSNTVAQEVAQITGVRTVLHGESRDLNLAQAAETALLPIAPNYGAILAPATSEGKDLIPRLAGKLDVAVISDVTAVIDSVTFERPIYAGNAIETIRSSDSKILATVRASSFEQAASGGSGKIVQLDVGATPVASRYVSENKSASTRPELTSAKVVVSGGRAFGSKEEFNRVLEPLADRLGAAIGASRAAVDSGYAPNDCQVGQTGKVVAPDLYIAIGISGAIQHLAGIRDARIIVAINKDPDAPIFSVADYGLVGDYRDLVPELMTALEGSG
jgi:electron transfer flavoprotein alpha subunit